MGILLAAIPLTLLARYFSLAFSEAFLVGLAAALVSLLLKFRLAFQTVQESPGNLSWYTFLSLALYVGALYAGYQIHGRQLMGLAGVSSALVLVIFILFVFGLTEIDIRGTALHSSATQEPDRKESH